MNTPEEIKSLVRDKYTIIANQNPELNAVSCCGIDGCETLDYSIFSEDYTEMEGYLEKADLKLGCGMPVEYAGLKKGQTVVDLGSGAGNDCFVARAYVGEEGEVIGVDMTPVMIEKSKEIARDLKLKNVKFRLGEIENLPLAGNRADVVISNCVLNLVPNKEKAFAETFRILKPGGHFCISDVVTKGDLPDEIRTAGEMYAGCVAGALKKEEYLGIIHETGFQCVSVKTEKRVEVPDDILLNYMDADKLEAFRASGTGIYSITVTGVKEASCDPASGCC